MVMSRLGSPHNVLHSTIVTFTIHMVANGLEWFMVQLAGTYIAICAVEGNFVQHSLDIAACADEE